MEKKIILLCITGLLITLLLLFVDIYLAGIAFILLIAILMSLLIMQDTAGIPDIAARLRDDAKAILLTNKGNAKAVNIHAALVPLDKEFEVPVLEEDATYEIPLSVMAEEMKIVLTYENDQGRKFSRSAHLSALEEEPDLLKPMIPIFKWKK